MPAATVPISPVSNSGKKSLTRIFSRSRLSYRNIGKSKCRSTIPWSWRRVIRSSIDSDEGLICVQRNLADSHEQSAVACGFRGAHAPRVLSLAPRQRLFLSESKKHFGEAPKSAREARALPREETHLRGRTQCHFVKLPAVRPQFPSLRLDVLAAANQKRGARATRLFLSEQAVEPK